MQSLLKKLKPTNLHQLSFSRIFITLLMTLPATTSAFLLSSQKTVAQSVACQSPYNEVYAVTQAAGTPDFYTIHAPTGAATKFTSAPSSFGVTAINTAATDHVNKMVYYGDANKIYAWDAINDQHITVAANFQSLLTTAGYTGKFVTLSSGGAAFYGGALYVGVDGNRNLGAAPTNFDQDFEIFRVNLSADGKTAVSVTPLGIKAKSGGTFTTNTMDDWGDFIISDTGTILALSTNRITSPVQRRFWKFDLNSNTYSFVTNTTENAQLAKSGDGTLWGLRSTSVVKFDGNGNVIGSPVTTTVQAFDGTECVVGNASVGDRVWNDTNGDGVQDAGEAGIAGVTVAIYRDINKNGVIDTGEPKLATQVTDANGNYDFTGLLPHDRLTGSGHNDFIVKVESGVPANYTATTPTQKNADLSSATEDFNSADFGYKSPTYNISGTLFEDSDGGDDLDATEPKLPANITVKLLDSNNNVIKTTATDANGNYTFTNVISGSYKVQVDTADTDISSDLTLGTPNDLAVTVGANITGQNFGFDKNTIPSPVVPSYCKSIYNEVYAVTQAAGTPDFYAIHAPTGAATKFTSAPSSFGVTAINTAATDHVNKMVYYGDANKIYAWDAINDQHITVAANFQSLLTTAGYTGKFVTLSSGGAAFYGGALYVGVDGNRNLGAAPTNFDQDFEIFRVNLSADGKTAVSVTPLGIKAKSGGTFTTNTMDDWGDFIISDTGTILALSTNRITSPVQRRFWKFDLNSNTYSFVTNTTENAQLAKSGDGTLWGLRSTSVVKFDGNGNVIGSPVTTTVQAFDGTECVVGNASVGDRVWNDTNGDGVQDAGEAGIAGVTVAIYRDINKNGVIDTGEPKLATQVTDANGNYDFTGLLPHDRLTGSGHNDFIVKVESGVPTGATDTTPTVKAADLSSTTEDFNNADFGYRLPAAGNPNVLLVKRITRVNNNTITKNGDNLAGYIDEATNSYDDNILDNPAPVGKADTNKWVDADNNGEPDLIGGINGGNVRPGDEIEYTIYYLSTGDTTANNVLICDLVPENTAFMPTAFNSFPTKNTSSLASGDRGIIWQHNGVIESLTSVRDGDTAEYLFPGIDPTTNYPGIKCDGSNTNGVVVVKLGNIPNATAPGTPNNSYGFIRFRGRVK